MDALIIPKKFNKIISKIDIVDIIGGRMVLIKKGNNFVSLCPFHIEKNPSFVVSRDKQIYHCFGCGREGNAIDFIARYDCVSVLEAVRKIKRLLQ